MSEKQCIFCAIIAKAAHGFIVYENPHAVVFLDRRPINVGHLLIVPRQHVEALYALDEPSFIAFMLVVKRMAAMLEAIYLPQNVVRMYRPREPPYPLYPSASLHVNV